MVTPGGDLDPIRNTGGKDHSLRSGRIGGCPVTQCAEFTAAPGIRISVVAESDTIEESGGNGRPVSHSWRDGYQLRERSIRRGANSQLPKIIVAPRVDLPVSCQCKAMPGASGNVFRTDQTGGTEYDICEGGCACANAGLPGTVVTNTVKISHIVQRKRMLAARGDLRPG